MRNSCADVFSLCGVFLMFSACLQLKIKNFDQAYAFLSTGA